MWGTSILWGVFYLIILIIIYNVWVGSKTLFRVPGVIAVTREAEHLDEHLDPGFNRKYDKTFHMSMLDKESDKMKDQFGYTLDDYLLGDVLYRQHAA